MAGLDSIALEENRVDDEERNAIHEAGHAVAFHRIFPGNMADEISIVPDEEIGSQGHYRPLYDTGFIEASYSEEEIESHLTNDAICTCAGYAAEMVAGYPEDRAQWRYVSDFERAGRLLGIGKAKALELMRQPENQRAVKRVGQELLVRKRLTAEEVSILIDVADGGTTEDEYQAYLALRAQHRGKTDER